MFLAACFSDRVVWRGGSGYLAMATVLLVVARVLSATTTFAAGSIYDYAYPGDWRSTRMWVPESVDSIKGILIVGNGAGGDRRNAVNDLSYKLFAELHDFAVIGTSQWGNMYPAELDMWDQNLVGLASASGHPELVNAPWAPIGLSNGGQMSYGFNALRPEKVLAFIANKGGYYNDPLPSEDALKTPGILIAGELDTELRRTNIHALFTDNRPRGALWSWVEEEGKGHSGTADELVLPLMAEAIRLRYPADQTPTATSGVTLRELNEADGWLIDVSSTRVNPQTEMAPYADYTGNRSVAGWLPDEGIANLFRAFATYDKDASFLSPPVSTSDQLPVNARLIINTQLVPNWSKIEVFDYVDSVTTVFSDGRLHALTFLDTAISDPGVHGLFALVTHADGMTVSTTNVIAYITVPEPGTLALLGSDAVVLFVWLVARNGRSRRRG